MAKEKVRILAIGDAVVTTGFARVMHGIFENLPRSRYEIHHLGVNYRGDPHDYKVKIYPAMLGGEFSDIYGIKRIGPILDAVQPHLVFILNDIWVMPMYLKELEKYKDRGFKIVTYSPVDAKPLEWRWLTHFSNVDRMVLYTNFAKDVVEKSIEVWRDTVGEENVIAPETSVVPHGVDNNTFYPIKDIKDKSGNVILSGRLNAKRKIYPNEDDFINSFVVLNANRNQPRKRIDLTMEGFAKFAQDKPKNVKLYLHMGVEDMGWNVIWMAERLGIDSRLILSSNNPQMPQVTDERLNLIYNACDVGVNTSLGEGWGLVSFEHGATRAAQVVPNHSCQSEIWEDSAELIDIDRWYTTERILTEGGFVSTDDLADKLQRLYDDPKYLEEMSRKAYKLTKKSKFEWKNVSKKFDTIFKEVLG